jgi:hypothetical protein
MDMYGDDVVRVQQVSKWCRQFENGRTVIHHYDRSGLPDMSVVDLNTAQV